MHHVDVHIADLARARRLLDAFMPLVGYELRSEYPDFVSYWRAQQRPAIGFIPDRTPGSAAMRLAFAVGTREGVDRVARVVREHGALCLEGPGFHPEYGDDYYAVFSKTLMETSSKWSTIAPSDVGAIDLSCA